MKVDESKVSIANLRDMLDRGDLSINRSYQRQSGLWPNSARSYFIDTILEGYPFPKVYFHEYLDRQTKKVRTDLIDGQQRITTIQDFLQDKLVLGGNSKRHQGNRFSDLDEETQDKFLFYVIATDVIRDAGVPEILQMFRRMNAYTLPLNAAEKRNSEFSGEFKGFVNRVLDSNTLLTEWHVFTPRQTIRLADAAFIADLFLSVTHGILSTSDKKLHDLYREFDENFPDATVFEERFRHIFTFITLELSKIQESFMTKPAAMHSLFCAIYHNIHGLPSFARESGLDPIGKPISTESERATSNLLLLAEAHQDGDMSRFSGYVNAMSAGSNRQKQRIERVTYICRALRDKL